MLSMSEKENSKCPRMKNNFKAIGKLISLDHDFSVNTQYF